MQYLPKRAYDGKYRQPQQQKSGKSLERQPAKGQVERQNRKIIRLHKLPKKRQSGQSLNLAAGG
jgi:hypothetical protein